MSQAGQRRPARVRRGTASASSVASTARSSVPSNPASNSGSSSSSSSSLLARFFLSPLISRGPLGYLALTASHILARSFPRMFAAPPPRRQLEHTSDGGGDSLIAGFARALVDNDSSATSAQPGDKTKRGGRSSRRQRASHDSNEADVSASESEDTARSSRRHPSRGANSSSNIDRSILTTHSDLLDSIMPPREALARYQQLSDSDISSERATMDEKLSKLQDHRQQVVAHLARIDNGLVDCADCCDILDQLIHDRQHARQLRQQQQQQQQQQQSDRADGDVLSDDSDGGRHYASLISSVSGGIDVLTRSGAHTPSGRYGVDDPDDEDISSTPHDSLGSLRLASVLDGHFGPVSSIDIDSRCDLIATGSSDTTVRLWSAERGACSALVDGCPEAVSHVAVVDDAVVSASRDGLLRAHSIPLLHSLRYSDASGTTPPASPTLFNHVRPVELCGLASSSGMRHGTSSRPAAATAMASAGNRSVATGGADRTVRVWDIAAGRSAFSLDFSWIMRDSDLASAAHYSASGSEVSPGVFLGGFVGALQCERSLLVAGTAEGAVRLCDMRTGQVQRTLYAHRGPVSSLLLDDRMVVSGGLDGAVRMWDMRGSSSGTAEPAQIDTRLPALSKPVGAIVRAPGSGSSGGAILFSAAGGADVHLYDSLSLQHRTISLPGAESSHGSLITAMSSRDNVLAVGVSSEDGPYVNLYRTY